jgi:arylsulfatase A-like enzyme
MKARSTPVSPLAGALGFLTAWIVLGVVNVVAVTVDLPRAPSFWSVRAVHHLVDFGRHVSAGLTAFALVCSWKYWRENVAGRPVWRARLEALGLVFGLALLVALVFVRDDVLGMAQRNSESTGLPASLLEFAFVATVAGALPLAVGLGFWLRRGLFRLLPLPAVAVAHWLNVTTSTRDNHGLHLFLSLFAATLLAASCTWPERWVSEVRARRRSGLVALGVLLAFSLIGLALPLTNSQRVDLALWDANLLPNLTLGRYSLAHGAKGSAGTNPYFVSRRGQPDLPARPHDLLGKDGVVVLLSIDAVRADVFDKKGAQRFPHLWRLMNGGTSFRNARSPGSATVYTLSALSTGQTFSQRYWSKTKGDFWPFEDEAVHFPELLEDAGVATLHARSTQWLENDRRILHGFSAEVFPLKDWKWVRGKDLASGLIDLLKKHPDGPVFAFAHFLDTHHPYWPGRKKAKDARGQYLHALSYVDGQVGRVLDALEALGLEERAIVIVTSDHGEAFGEHGTHAHATTLYEEQVRVPLVFFGKTIEKRKVDDAVTLLDLGPTVLELFGQNTPAQFMGQSLLPLLQGQKMTFERPIVAEARTLQSLVSLDGIKVIRDRRTQTIEIYDLEADPGELTNLSDEADPRLTAAAARLDEFFETHTFRRDGYEIPLRK